jgi:antitoxin HicB
VTRQAAREATTERTPDSYPIVLASGSNGDGAQWTASVEELPGCEAHGSTPESAAAGVQEAVERWIEEARADGREIPPPGAAAAHSGRLLVRMPRSLHAELVRASEREGTSLNAYIVAALSASVAWRRPGEPPAGSAGEERQTQAGAPSRPSRGVSAALTANLVVLAIAAAIAIALLITAWTG